MSVRLQHGHSAPRPVSPFELRRDEAVLRGVSVGFGPPVIFLHAGLERRQVWDPVIDELLRHVEVQCVAVDQRGHGESTGSADGLQPFAEDAASLVAWVGRPSVVVGSSLGGLAAIAALAEKRVRASVIGLVMVDIIPDPDPIPVRTFLAEAGLLPAAAALADDMIGRRRELKEALVAFDGAVMLVRGGRSAITDGDVERLRSYCGRVQLASIPNASHLIARDEPVPLGRLFAQTFPAWFGASDIRRD